MAQLFEAVPSFYPDPILCYYHNSTRQMQTIRIDNIANWYFKRVVFPGQHLLFEAVREGKLKIYLVERGEEKFTSALSCGQLEVQELQPSPSSVLVGRFK
ncbi:DUF1830 domain-containing protein [Pleurocapsales cyanobacterium LEGE 06147]|nr:DUF1830 domain-containing protein [Pleurocapsales cyanobacterium LEGE 06147]